MKVAGDEKGSRYTRKSGTPVYGRAKEMRS